MSADRTIGGDYEGKGFGVRVKRWGPLPYTRRQHMEFLRAAYKTYEISYYNVHLEDWIQTVRRPHTWGRVRVTLNLN